jgi:choline-glycine betaine transporter
MENDEIGAIITAIIFAYMVIGFLSAVDNSENNNKIRAFLFLFWPVAFLISAYKGFKEFIGGGT